MTQEYLDSPAPPPTLIVVLGMHRSGTSVLTRAMETMGAELGSRLMPPIEGVNNKGFFEDLDINRINIEVMHAAGSDWHAMLPIDLNTIAPDHLAELREKASAVLRAKCDGKIFALKDPRISRLLPFWRPIFASLQSRVVYAIAVRDPISVARSLAKRDHLADEKSHLLWLGHTVSALELTRDEARTVISYDALIDAPREELTRISADLQLPLIEAQLDAFEREFLDDTLRHARFDAREVERTCAAPRQVKALFTALDDTVHRHLPLDNAMLAATLESARTYLDDIEPVLRHEWQLDRLYAAARLELGAREEVIRHRDQAIATLDEQLSLMNDLRARLDAALEENQSRQAQVDTLRQTSASLEMRMLSLEAELASARQSLTDLHASTSWRVTRPLRALKRVTK